MSNDMIILSRTYDLLQWILPHAEKFPKTQRFVLTKRLTDALFNFSEALYFANSVQGDKRLEQLHRADAHLNQLRLYLRLAHQFGWLSDGQYAHVSKMIEEIGRLLGGWIKQTKRDRHT